MRRCLLPVTAAFIAHAGCYLGTDLGGGGRVNGPDRTSFLAMEVSTGISGRLGPNTAIAGGAEAKGLVAFSEDEAEVDNASTAVVGGTVRVHHALKVFRDSAGDPAAISGFAQLSLGRAFRGSATAAPRDLAIGAKLGIGYGRYSYKRDGIVGLAVSTDLVRLESEMLWIVGLNLVTHIGFTEKTFEGGYAK